MYVPHFNLPETGEDVFERMDDQHRPLPSGHARHLPAVAVLDGETIVASEVEIGYLHRCFEKMCETHSWQHVIPYTDRLNYCSASSTTSATARRSRRCWGRGAAEAVWARTILSEFSRIMDHCVCNGTTLVDAGGLTNFCTCSSRARRSTASSSRSAAPA